MNETKKQMAEINVELQRLRIRKRQLSPPAKKPLNPWSDVDVRRLSKAEEVELTSIEDRIRELERRRQQLRTRLGNGG